MKKDFDLKMLGLTNLKTNEVTNIEGGSEDVDPAWAVAKSVGKALVDGVNWLSGWVNRGLF